MSLKVAGWFNSIGYFVNKKYKEDKTYKINLFMLFYIYRDHQQFNAEDCKSRR